MRTMAVLVGKNVLKDSYAVAYAVKNLVRSVYPVGYSPDNYHHGMRRTAQTY